MMISFVLLVFTDVGGERRSLGSYQGRVTLVRTKHKLSSSSGRRRRRRRGRVVVVVVVVVGTALGCGSGRVTSKRLQRRQG